MNSVKVLGLCGFARCGKDTFFSITKGHLPNMGLKPFRISFADALKDDVREFLLDKTGIDSFTEKTEEKEIIRDFLVAYGTKLMRKINNKCWIEKITNTIEEKVALGYLPVLTDVRYENELDWVKSLGGSNIHITRVGNPPANEEEANNDPILKNKADYKFIWEDFGDVMSGQDVYYVKSALNKVFENELAVK